MDRIRVNDDSSDRKYFTIIPNYIANHSTANDQALYFQMKKHAGEDGECYVSEKTLKQKLGIGSVALKASFKYLLDHDWIKYVGYKDVQTSGGIQKIKSYSIVDIWKLNVDHYESTKGVAENDPLVFEGFPEMPQGLPRNEQRGAVSSNKEEPILNKNPEEEIQLSLKRKELVKKYKPDFLK